jgi:Raf kinase inhibitor-like YbhB/YbcL family protein
MRRAAVVLVSGVFAVTGCGSSSRPTGASQPSIAVSSDFRPGSTIPRVHTCDGQDLSPPLRAVRLPRGSQEVVIVMRDHDAPGGDFIHWAIAHVAPRAGEVSLAAGRRPVGAVLGGNSFGSLGYRGPCPPAGDAPHHYELAVYALSRPSMLKTGFSAGVLASLPVLAHGSLTGVYARSKSRA